MKVIIPLAGKGTRMRPHTHTKARALLPVAGKPVLDHIIDSLSKLNITEYIFVTGHLKEQIEEHVKKKYTFKSRFVEQKVINGSAGAILALEKHIKEPVLIVFCDTIFDADLSALNDTQEDGIIWAMEVENYQRFGVIVHDDDGYVTDMVEKPKEPVSKLANVGMYYIKNYALLFKKIAALYKAEPNKEQDLPDALRDMVYAGEKFKVAELDGWYDCGKPETTLETNAILLAKKHQLKTAPQETVINDPVYIGEGCEIVGSVIGPNVSIADNCTINNAVISDCIIDEGSTVKNITLHDSILGESTRLEGAGHEHKASVLLGDHSETRLRK